MKCINLYGGPCTGKTTTAAQLFGFLKEHHINTDVVGEVAKELIYIGNEKQLLNQIYVMGLQYRKQKDLQRYGVDIAITDAPLMLQLVYSKNHSYFNELAPLVNKLNSEFDNIDIFIRRNTPYQVLGRVHTEEESKKIDSEIWDLMDGKFHYVVEAGRSATEFLQQECLKIADKYILDKF